MLITILLHWVFELWLMHGGQLLPIDLDEPNYLSRWYLHDWSFNKLHTVPQGP